jgi:hypothetical protein
MHRFIPSVLKVINEKGIIVGLGKEKKIFIYRLL